MVSQLMRILRIWYKRVEPVYRTEGSYTPPYKQTPLMTVVNQKTGPDGEVVVDGRFGPDYINSTTKRTPQGIPVVEEGH